MKPFVYLIQAESHMPYPDLPDAHNDIILLTWKKPSLDAHAIFYPDSTWNQGRNRLLTAAIARAEASGNPYLYYIFLDEDCVVREDRELAAALNLPLTGNPFRTFEYFLTKWEPAVGYTRYSWQYHEPGTETNIGYNIDALFNAYHREAVPFLLPYFTGFDADSWLYSQNMINHLTAMLYNPYRMQFNVLKTGNKTRRRYRQRGRDWSVPTRFLYRAIQSDLKRRMNLRDPNTIYPNPGRPLKKNRSYVISSAFMEKHFDLRHPFIQSRRFLLSPNFLTRGHS